MALKPYKLANEAGVIRMPSGRKFGEGFDGIENIDPENPRWSHLIREGSIVPHEPEPEKPAKGKSKPDGDE